MKKKTRIVELVFSDDSQELTIDAISLVSSPAIEEDFVFFGKEKNNLTLAKVDEEKRMLISPALIPNKQIFRYDANTDSDYYVYFSKDTVRQASELYLKHNNHHKATYEHEDRVSGVLTIESWVKEGEQDKSNLYGFDLPVGTWFVKMKIENDELWKEIKNGTLKGLSIEGYFVDKMEKMSKTITDEQIRAAYKELQAEGKVKVELGLVDDLKININSLKSNDAIIKEVYANMRKIESQMSSLLPKAAKSAKVANEVLKSTPKKVELAEKKVAQVVKAAKDLGINPNEIKEIKEIEKLVKENNNGWKDIKYLINFIDQLAKI